MVRDERRAAPSRARPRRAARRARRSSRPYADRTTVGDDDQLPPFASSARESQRSFTKRRREPRPFGPPPISTSSAIERMIAIPRPPSVSSLRRRRARRCIGLEAGAVVGDLDDQPVVAELEADLDVPVAVAVGVADRVRARLGERELQVGERLVRERPDAREPGEGEPRERDVLRLRRDRQPDGPAVVGRCACSVARSNVYRSFSELLDDSCRAYCPESARSKPRVSASGWPGARPGGRARSRACPLPPRSTVTATVCPGRRRSVTIRATSAARSTVRAGEARRSGRRRG